MGLECSCIPRFLGKLPKEKEEYEKGTVLGSCNYLNLTSECDERPARAEGEKKDLSQFPSCVLTVLASPGDPRMHWRRRGPLGGSHDGESDYVMTGFKFSEPFR